MSERSSSRSQFVERPKASSLPRLRMSTGRQGSKLRRPQQPHLEGQRPGARGAAALTPAQKRSSERPQPRRRAPPPRARRARRIPRVSIRRSTGSVPRAGDLGERGRGRPAGRSPSARGGPGRGQKPWAKQMSRRAPASMWGTPQRSRRTRTGASQPVAARSCPAVCGSGRRANRCQAAAGPAAASPVPAAPARSPALAARPLLIAASCLSAGRAGQVRPWPYRRRGRPAGAPRPRAFAGGPPSPSPPPGAARGGRRTRPPASRAARERSPRVERAEQPALAHLAVLDVFGELGRRVGRSRARGPGRSAPAARPAGSAQGVHVGGQRAAVGRDEGRALPSTRSPLKQTPSALRKQTWSAAWPGVARARRPPCSSPSPGRTTGGAPDPARRLGQPAAPSAWSPCAWVRRTVPMPPRSAAAARIASRWRGVVGAGVDHRAGARAVEVGVGACQGHRPRVGGEDPEDLGVARGRLRSSEPGIAPAPSATASGERGSTSMLGDLVWRSPRARPRARARPGRRRRGGSRAPARRLPA